MKNSWEFVYILANYCKCPFNLTKFLKNKLKSFWRHSLVLERVKYFEKHLQFWDWCPSWAMLELVYAKSIWVYQERISSWDEMFCLCRRMNWNSLQSSSSEIRGSLGRGSSVTKTLIVLLFCQLRNCWQWLRVTKRRHWSLNEVAKITWFCCVKRFFDFVDFADFASMQLIEIVQESGSLSAQSRIVNAFHEWYQSLKSIGEITWSKNKVKE